jgi:hypothetical protein
VIGKSCGSRVNIARDALTRVGHSLRFCYSVSNDSYPMNSANVPQARSRRIVITAYDGVSLLDLSGPLEAFRVASAFADPRGHRGSYEC